MSGSPRITFAIPYYRGRDYLSEAIGSVLAQTVSDWQLLVVDDCGPEPADDVVAAFHDPRITYVRNERNLGLAGNWNECVRLTTTPPVTILHGDDRLLPDYAARVLAAAEAQPGVTVLFTDTVNIDGDGAPTRTPADIVKGLLPGARATTSSRATTTSPGCWPGTTSSARPCAYVAISSATHRSMRR
ncbi:glycosyltransferase family 2 protein [Nocardioides sp. B-3]|uniref:glycosyltransferase family 2 protein n=1 Tax=Nocardioides sp. B-3 TaxID=2895565 RepID=UPI00215348C4|nr:glycosyltransferase family 2 protein [Nocardioides sp. B-3]UUZ60009.1 glycosyltransferase [Nocardioides sp. B-3]